MIIKTLKQVSKPLSEFNHKEWPLADIEHYGQILDWNVKKFNLVAYDNESIIGTLSFKIEVGVAYIGTLIVAKNMRGNGVGKKLMNETEEIAKSNSAHKLYLQTGKTWDSIPFYERLGYKITGELPNHYFHQDFVELTKFLQ